MKPLDLINNKISFKLFRLHKFRLNKNKHIFIIFNTKLKETYRITGNNLNEIQP